MLLFKEILVNQVDMACCCFPRNGDTC